MRQFKAFPVLVKLSFLLLLLLTFTPHSFAFIPAIKATPGDKDSRAIPAIRAYPHLSPTPTPQPHYFDEEFNNPSLDVNRWDIFENNGSYLIENGVLTFTPSPNLPYIRTKTNPFPTSGQFVLEYGIKYNEVTGKGSGLSITKIIHDNSNIFWQGDNLIAVWQDLGDRLSIYEGQLPAYLFG